MSGRGRFSSPGLTTHRGSDLKVNRQSWRQYNASLAITLAADFSSCSRTTAPGCCTCRGPLSWQAAKAGEGSYWPGNLSFASVLNRILLLTLAGEFSNLLLQLRRASSNKKWQIITFPSEKEKNHYFFMLKSNKLLLFLTEKSNLFSYSYKSFTDTDRGTPFTCRGRIMIPGLPLGFC